MPFAILRFSKLKGGPATAIEAHHERKKEAYASNPDIDRNRSPANYHLVTPTASYYREIQTRIERAGCKARKDSIRFVDTILTASPEFFAERTPADARAFFAAALEFLRQEVGEKNIFSAVVHMDERTPHMHLCFVPLTADNRLSAKEILGNRQKFIAWQDKYHAHMQARFPELERGSAAMETGRKHIPTRLFKQSVHLSHQMERIHDVLDGINALNARRKREEVLSLLEQWYPGVEVFETQINRLNAEFQALRASAAQLSAAVDAKDHRNRESAAQLTVLEGELRRYQRLWSLIPQEVRDEYTEKRKERGAER